MSNLKRTIIEVRILELEIECNILAGFTMNTNFQLKWKVKNALIAGLKLQLDELPKQKQTSMDLEMIDFFENAIDEINYHRNKIDNNFWRYGDAKIFRNAIHNYENFINYLKGADHE